MARLTDTQLVILSSASRRNDRGVDLPANVTGEALRKAVDKLIRTGLLEEVRANGSLLAWRRDAEAGPMALRITEDSALGGKGGNRLATEASDRSGFPAPQTAWAASARAGANPRRAGRPKRRSALGASRTRRDSGE
jgi:hypothetical protein